MDYSSRTPDADSDASVAGFFYKVRAGGGLLNKSDFV
jgi:hypothetical protein